jgi:hypothetical protein
MGVYYHLQHNGSLARQWLARAVEYNHPLALELYGNILMGTRSGGANGAKEGVERGRVYRQRAADMGVPHAMLTCLSPSPHLILPNQLVQQVAAIKDEQIEPLVNKLCGSGVAPSEANQWIFAFIPLIRHRIILVCQHIVILLHFLPFPLF